MARSTTFPPSTRPTPLYVAVGAGGLVVERIRRTNLERESLQRRIETRIAEFKGLPAQVRALPERAQSVASEAIDQATSVYVDLAERGEELVARIRGQESTQTAKPQATTASASKTAESSAKATKATEAAEKVGD